MNRRGKKKSRTIRTHPKHGILGGRWGRGTKVKKREHPKTLHSKGYPEHWLKTLKILGIEGRKNKF